MKNSIRVLFLVGLFLLILLPFQSYAQEVAAQAGGGLFSKIGGFLKGQFIGFVVGAIGTFLGNKGWLALAKKFAKKTEEVSIQLSEFFADLGGASHLIDTAIKDDNTIDANTLMEALEKYKHVVVEGKDVIIAIKPKPTV